LQTARLLAKVPFSINSAVRCIKHNKHVGGSVNSSHILGLAIDIKADTSSKRYRILKALMFVGINRIGVYKDFIHVDIDTNKPSKLIWYR